MNLKILNKIFAYGLFGVGALKIISVILVFMQTITILNNSGGELNYGYFMLFAVVVNWVSILLAIGSIIMIFANSVQQPEVIVGYLWGLGALFLPYIIPSWSWLTILGLFAQCSMYMKAGSKIMDNNVIYKNEYRPKTSKKLIKHTEWFYRNKNEQMEQEKIKIQKRKEKLEKELEEWKQLLDTGEIDEETYNQETSRLIEKERKRSEQDKQTT